jgi:hypothetical protein
MEAKWSKNYGSAQETRERLQGDQEKEIEDN